MASLGNEDVLLLFLLALFLIGVQYKEMFLANVSSYLFLVHQSIWWALAMRGKSS